MEITSVAEGGTESLTGVGGGIGDIVFTIKEKG